MRCECLVNVLVRAPDRDEAAAAFDRKRWLVWWDGDDGPPKGKVVPLFPTRQAYVVGADLIGLIPYVESDGGTQDEFQFRLYAGAGLLHLQAASAAAAAEMLRDVPWHVEEDGVKVVATTAPAPSGSYAAVSR